MQFQIELEDDGQYAATGVGIVSFKRESGNPLHLRDVLYVRGLKQNLISIATLEGKGYDIIFRRGKSYLQHLAFGCKKQIGVRVNNLYKLQVETNAALSNKARSSQSREVMVEQEKDRSLKMEPQALFQFQSKLVGSWVDQHDDEEHSSGRVEADTQSETSRIGRVRAKLEEDLSTKDHDRIGSSTITSSQRKQSQRYTG